MTTREGLAVRFSLFVEKCLESVLLRACRPLAPFHVGLIVTLAMPIVTFIVFSGHEQEAR